MLPTKNRVSLIGNLGHTPEIKEFDGGKKMAKVSLATSDTYKDKGGERHTDTQWHNLVAWGKAAEFFEKQTKAGTRVSVEGKLMTRTYLDKQGQKKYYTEIQVNEAYAVNPGKNEDGVEE
jgi:single-strand DNA-binding protein